MDAVADPKAFRTRFTGEVMRFLRAWALAGNPARDGGISRRADAAYDFKRLAETAHRPSAREHRGDVHRPPALDAQAKHLGHVVETIGWMFEMAGNDDRCDDKGVDENGTSPRFSSHATSPRLSSRATSPRFSSNAAERGARAFAEMAASAVCARWRRTPPPRCSRCSRLSLGLGRIARSAETSLSEEGWAPGWDPSDVSTFARAATRALESSATEPQHARTRATVWKRSRPRVDLIFRARRGTRWTRRTRDGEGARRRSSPRSTPSGRASRRREVTVTSRRRRRPRRGDGEGGETPLGKIARGGGESVGATREVPRRDAPIEAPSPPSWMPCRTRNRRRRSPNSS